MSIEMRGAVAGTAPKHIQPVRQEMFSARRERYLVRPHLQGISSVANAQSAQ